MKKAAALLGSFVAATLLAIIVSRIVSACAAGRTFSDIAQIPNRSVGLVLALCRGHVNPFFEARIERS